MILTKTAQSASKLSQISERKKNQFLTTLANFLWQKRNEIQKANIRDVENASKQYYPKAFIDRLKLKEKDIESIIHRLQGMQKLDADLGEIIEERRLANGLLLKKIRVPLGVIAIIYESRPEVTIDVAALCIKSGNAAILKGGSEAQYTNQMLYQCIADALKQEGLPRESVAYIYDRRMLSALLKRDDCIDLVIARGSYTMVKSITERSKIPVLAHSAGGARIYVDKSANFKKALNIIINAKVTKPSACNSLDTVLIHKNIAKDFVSELTKHLRKSGVEIIKPTNKDWEEEFLDLKIAIKIVDSLDEALAFINRYTKKHSEGIIAQDKETIKRFVSSIDAAALFVNSSTRLHDGYEFGLGAEMGIATGKLHARGPVGLKELTTYKWVAYGNGHIRE